ncbi:hypothetical protein [Nannocystis pusilla]|uniref:hypothetical protein n=1 Tax=Nannocystis pusilla TaxID=889268 RepID=UPI003BF16CAA
MNSEILVSVRIGTARLEVLAPCTTAKYYTPRPQEDDVDRPVEGVRARIISGRRSTWIGSFRELIRWSEDREIDIRSAVESCPNEFARFSSFMDIEHYVRVVEVPALYDYPGFDFDVDLRRELPRVEGDALLFVAGRTTFTSVAMWRFRVELRTGLVEEWAVPRR